MLVRMVVLGTSGGEGEQGTEEGEHEVIFCKLFLKIENDSIFEISESHDVQCWNRNKQLLSHNSEHTSPNSSYVGNLDSVI